MIDDITVWKGAEVPDDPLLQFRIAVYKGLGFALRELPRKSPSLTFEDQSGVERCGKILDEMAGTVHEAIKGHLVLGGDDEQAGYFHAWFTTLLGRFKPMLEQLAQVTAYDPVDLADRIAVRRVKESIAATRRDLKKCINAHLTELKKRENKDASEKEVGEEKSKEEVSNNPG